MTTAPRHRTSAMRRVWHARDLADLKRDQGGVAALEFAMLAPVLIIALFGLLAVSQAVRAKMLLTSTASSMASMVAVQNVVTGSSLGTLRDFCNGAQLTMLPYSADSLSVAIGSYTLQSDSTVRQDWEYDSACKTTAASLAGKGIDLASPLLVEAGDSILIVQSNYSYTSSYTRIVPNMTLSQVAYARPRYGKVACTVSC